MIFGILLYRDFLGFFWFLKISKVRDFRDIWGFLRLFWDILRFFGFVHEHINDWTSIFYCLFEASFVAAQSKVCLELIRQNSVIFLILLFSKSKYINKLENCRQLTKNIFKTFFCMFTTYAAKFSHLEFTFSIALYF